MRARDILIVAVALLCCIVVWSQQGTVSLHPGFKIPVADDETRVFVMAKPLVFDPLGDGHPVLVAATSAVKLSIFNTHYVTANVEEVFVPPPVRQEVYTYGRVLGFGAGKVNINSSASVLAVLTSDYRLSLYRPESQYSVSAWEVVVAPQSSWTNVLHASVSVVPESVYAEDKGMVAIAVTTKDARGVELTLFAAFSAEDGESRWQYLSDAANDIDEVVHEAGVKTLLQAGELNLPPGAQPRVLLAEHLPKEAKGVGRRYEKPWTTFREAVIAALPHHYNHPWDAQLRPHVLYPQKAKRKKLSHAGSKLTFLKNNRIVRMDTEDYGIVGEKLNLWAEEKPAKPKSPLNTYNNPENSRRRRQRKLANAFVYHGRAGVEVIHMYTGNIVTQVVPLRADDGTYYHDINDDFHIEAIKTQIGPRMSLDGAHGADLIDDCLGMIYTGAPVADEELFNATICDTQGFFGNLDLIHHFVDGDVRGQESPHTLNTLELLGSSNVVSKTTRSVTPLVVQVHSSKGRGLSQMERYAVFMIDSGLMTCLDPSRRRVLWRTQTVASFADSAQVRAREADAAGYVAAERESLTRPYPHLAAYSFYQPSLEDDRTSVTGGRGRYRRTEPYVIAVGESAMAVVNTKNGKVMRSVRLPDEPIAPIIVVDFNGDGVNDVIVVTQRHIYGFIGRPQASTSTVTSLLILMVALLVLLLLAREMTPAGEETDDDNTMPIITSDERATKNRTHKRATD